MQHIINKSFGYPVLRESSDDYIDGAYVISTDIKEIENDEEGQTSIWQIEIDIDLSNQDIKELIDNKDAEFIVIISCPLTYYQKYIRVSGNSVKVKIDASIVLNEMNVTSYVIAKKDIKNYSSISFHKDYDGLKFDLKKGMVLAIADPFTYFVNTELLKDISSIFQRVIVDGLKDYEWSLDYNHDSIQFYVNKTTNSHINENETNGSLQLNALILPAILEILYVIKDNYDEFSHYKWFKAIENKAMNLGYDDISTMLEDPEYHRHAQNLCQNPLSLAGGN